MEKTEVLKKINEEARKFHGIVIEKDIFQIHYKGLKDYAGIPLSIISKIEETETAIEVGFTVGSLTLWKKEPLTHLVIYGIPLIKKIIGGTNEAKEDRN